jgi:hypothetical protein
VIFATGALPLGATMRQATVVLLRLLANLPFLPAESR